MATKTRRKKAARRTAKGLIIRKGKNVFLIPPSGLGSPDKRQKLNKAIDEYILRSGDALDGRNFVQFVNYANEVVRICGEFCGPGWNKD